jgi:spore coat protein U-like protein
MSIIVRSLAAALLALCAAALTPGTARAAQCTGTGVGGAGITLSVTGLTFGAYDPTNVTAAASTTSVTVQCNSTARTLPPISIAINAGDSGSFTARAMDGTGTAAGAVLTYQLYDNSTHSTIWGDGTGGTATVSGGNGTSYTQTFTGYGQVPVSQYTTPGNYADTLTVTMTY